jgi:stress-induced morphogen
MNNLEHVKKLIESKMPESIVEVGDLTGTQDHLNIIVYSDDFKGKMLIDQHQMIMDILKEDLKDLIHAVKIKTMTKDKYKE